MRTSLRRDADYCAWYVRASAATCGARPPARRWPLIAAEDPAVAAPRARPFWSAEVDPSALRVVARLARARGCPGLPIHRLGRFLSVVDGEGGREYALLSDGLHHIRLDVEEGTLRRGPVVLYFVLDAAGDADAKLANVRRLAALCRERRFSPALFPPDPDRDRCLTLLRVADALRSGASQREVAELLFGVESVRGGWQGRSDSLRSRVRRLVSEARRLGGGRVPHAVARGRRRDRLSVPVAPQLERDDCGRVAKPIGRCAQRFQSGHFGTRRSELVGTALWLTSLHAR